MRAKITSQHYQYLCDRLNTTNAQTAAHYLHKLGIVVLPAQAASNGPMTTPSNLPLLSDIEVRILKRFHTKADADASATRMTLKDIKLGFSQFESLTDAMKNLQDYGLLTLDKSNRWEIIPYNQQPALSMNHVVYTSSSSSSSNPYVTPPRPRAPQAMHANPSLATLLGLPTTTSSSSAVIQVGLQSMPVSNPSLSLATLALLSSQPQPPTDASKNKKRKAKTQAEKHDSEESESEAEDTDKLHAEIKSLQEQNDTLRKEQLSLGLLLNHTKDVLRTDADNLRKKLQKIEEERNEAKDEARRALLEAYQAKLETLAAKNESAYYHNFLSQITQSAQTQLQSQQSMAPLITHAQQPIYAPQHSPAPTLAPAPQLGNSLATTFSLLQANQALTQNYFQPYYGQALTPHFFNNLNNGAPIQQNQVQQQNYLPQQNNVPQQQLNPAPQPNTVPVQEASQGSFRRLFQ